VLASVAVHDSAVELLLTLPPPYRLLALRRFALVLGWTALTAVLALLVFERAFPWAWPRLGPKGTPADQLIWLAPLLWFAGAGVLLALLLRSRAAAGAVLGTIWVSQLAFHDYFAFTDWAQPYFAFATLEGSYLLGAGFWLTNRLDLLVGAAVFFLAI